MISLSNYINRIVSRNAVGGKMRGNEFTTAPSFQDCNYPWFHVTSITKESEYSRIMYAE